MKEIRKEMIGLGIVSGLVLNLLPSFSQPVSACDGNSPKCESYRGWQTELVTKGPRIDITVVSGLPLADNDIIDLGFGLTARRGADWQGYWTYQGNRGHLLNVSGERDGKQVRGQVFCRTTGILDGGIFTTCDGTAYKIED